MLKDKNNKPIELQDYEAKEIVGVQIGQLGHKVWVCIDGAAVLRVKSPYVEVNDLRSSAEETNLSDEDWKVLKHLYEQYGKKQLTTAVGFLP